MREPHIGHSSSHTPIVSPIDRTFWQLLAAAGFFNEIDLTLPMATGAALAGCRTYRFAWLNYWAHNACPTVRVSPFLTLLLVRMKSGNTG